MTKEERASYDKDYRLKNRAKIKEYQREWYQKNREQCLTLRLKNRAKNLAYQREWYQKNREQRLALRREWCAKNPEYQREWYQKNREYFREYRRLPENKEQAYWALVKYRRTLKFQENRL